MFAIYILKAARSFCYEMDKSPDTFRRRYRRGKPWAALGRVVFCLPLGISAKGVRCHNYHSCRLYGGISWGVPVHAVRA